MYHLTVEREFCAAHALLIQGVREATHGHNFRLAVTVAGPALDKDGLLLDFHALERVVDELIRPWQNADLNASRPFSQGVNPSTELIAQHVGTSVRQALVGLAPTARLHSVRLTEAPGCAAVYLPDA